MLNALKQKLNYDIKPCYLLRQLHLDSVVFLMFKGMTIGYLLFYEIYAANDALGNFIKFILARGQNSEIKQAQA